MFDRRLITHFDWTLVALTLTLAGVGVATIYAATVGEGGGGSTLYIKQISWIGLGLAAMTVMFVVDYHVFERYAYLLYALAVALLVIVELIGKTAGGSQRWIDLGFFHLQPSETAKLALIVTMAKYFHHHRPRGGFGFAQLVVPFALVGVPMALVMMQPDLGTSLMLGLIFGTMLLLARVRTGALATLVVAALLAIPVGWSQLKPYQQARVMTLFDPDSDPLGAGYHIRQSKIAVGSGKFFGKGYLGGTQSHLHFLPEQHTDFIFSVFAEEWGFMGGVVLIALYSTFILWGLRVAARSKDRFGAFCAMGVVALFFWHAFINIGMVTGVLPVVGMPLPLVSYGGTSALVMMSAVGLLINVSMRRYRF